MLIRTLKWLFGIAMWIIATQGLAATVYLAGPPTASAQEQKILKSFVSELDDSLADMRLERISAAAASDLRGADKIIVALGENALGTILQGAGDSPLIAVFVSRSSYLKITSTRSTARAGTAIYSDPSPQRQIALVKSILGEGASAAVIVSGETVDIVADLAENAAELGVKLRVSELVATRNPDELLDALRGARVLLLEKDRELFELFPLETLLVLAYDLNSLGIVGYSSGVVANGALATTYTSLTDTVASTASAIREFERTGSLPPPGFSRHFSVAINKYVARSLQIPEKTASELKQAINTLLGGGHP